jgi:hypothetical protein
MGQKEMKCVLKFEKYFHMSQCYSGERCGPWASCSSYSSSPVLFCPGMFSENTQGINMKLSRMIV